MVFNEKWVDYGTSVSYRERGAAEVAKVGGVASLIRSVTPFSIYSPHTGWQYYEQGNLGIRIFNPENFCSSFLLGCAPSLDDVVNLFSGLFLQE